MAKKKPSEETAAFAYFADAAPDPAPVGRDAPGHDEEERIAQNVRIFLEKRPDSPWLGHPPPGLRSHARLEFSDDQEEE